MAMRASHSVLAHDPSAAGDFEELDGAPAVAAEEGTVPGVSADGRDEWCARTSGGNAPSLAGPLRHREEVQAGQGGGGHPADALPEIAGEA